MTALRINGARLLERHKLMAGFGETGNGGVIRPALSDEETSARLALLNLARERGFACSVDPIGNLFIRRKGADEGRAPLRMGSHLDSQIPGGNFDGVYGVIAGFEVLETLEDHKVASDAPIEVVVWNNEEGARFSPTTMGSAVHAGQLSLDKALGSFDQDGNRLGDELARSLTQLGPLKSIELGSESLAYVEAHIEQGPILEQNEIPIGVVTGIQGIVQFEVRITGEEAHAGTTPRSRRKDAFWAALDLTAQLRSVTADKDDAIRFTVGRLTVLPGSPNTVPAKVAFTIDLRHPDEALLASVHTQIYQAAETLQTPCEISVITTLNSPPVCFAAKVISSIERQAAEVGLDTARIASGATHDAKFMAPLCPTGMIFIPCRDGISHNENEWADPEHMIAGANTLLGVITELTRAKPT
ncbi:allantoate amidohydrolase [Aquamicrobium terrae]|uniref:N-carbamoyl-L-amino-acid hydrolase n=1 Tax=Aquamicrobium terrae TaxID=1324945 RepID=A0ABV2N0C7_9HYPH